MHVNGVTVIVTAAMTDRKSRLVHVNAAAIRGVLMWLVGATCRGRGGPWGDAGGYGARCQVAAPVGALFP